MNSFSQFVYSAGIFENPRVQLIVHNYTRGDFLRSRPHIKNGVEIKYHCYIVYFG